MAASPDWPADPRFRVAHNIPRAFARTGLIALPRADDRQRFSAGRRVEEADQS
jgi:hypothetical protein